VLLITGLENGLEWNMDIEHLKTLSMSIIGSTVWLYINLCIARSALYWLAFMHLPRSRRGHRPRAYSISFDTRTQPAAVPAIQEALLRSR